MTLAPQRRVPAQPPPDDATVIVRAITPKLADGVELIGEYEGSGFKEPPSLVRRADGQVIQLPPLLYRIAVLADGTRSYGEIAEAISAEIQRGLDLEDVKFLVEEKLHPLGLVCAPDGSSPVMEKPDPFLGLKFRAAVVPESVSGALGGTFSPLFFPLVVLSVLAAFGLADWWVFGVHGVAQSIRQALYSPLLFLVLFGAVVLTAAFHEIGHAAGCRYGGGRPGRMGCGLYLAWPAFYTDVTDAYRLGKRARLRTDLGGVYFNLIVVIATMAAYVLTRFEPLLLLIVVQHFEIAHQLLPIIRLDGYYIVSDLTGVPDLFARIGPILRSLVPGKKADERVTVLKPSVRVAVTLWVVVVVPMLLFELFILLVHLPRIVGTAWDSGVKMYDAAHKAFGSGQLLSGVSSGLQLVVLAIPIVGILLVLIRSTTGGSRWIWQHTAGRPVLRVFAVGVATTGLALLAYSWISPRNYTPIRPGERGTLTETVRAVRKLPDLPSQERPRVHGDDERQPEASTTTTTAPTTSTTAARRATQAPAGEPTTTAGPTTTSPSPSTTAATPTTRPQATTTVAP